jgi:hypothetical protein
MEHFGLTAFFADNRLFIAALGAVAAAIVGWVFTYLGWTKTHQNSLDLDKRRAELKFVSDQIQFLYGPLFSLGNASRVAIEAFAQKHAPGRNSVFDGSKKTPEEYHAWRTWMTQVMMPLNLRMEHAIIENSHLIDGPTMPDSFQVFLGHVAAYKAVLKNWEDSKAAGTLDMLTDLDHVSVVNFPKEFERDVEASFVKLRAKQLDLLSITEGQAATADSKP